MTLSSAFNIINSSFGTIGTQSSTIASNISNASTPGYSKQTANVLTDRFGGVRVASVTRVANMALATQLNTATSAAAEQSAISTGLATLAATVSDSSTATSSTGGLQNGDSPFAQLGNLATALTTYQSQPSNVASGQSAVAAAKTLAQSLNAGATTVTQVRTKADQDIADAVKQVNSALTQLQSINANIVDGLATNKDVGGLQDQRDTLVGQIAQQIGVSSSINPDGSLSLYTDSGVTLFQGIPSTLSFTPSGLLGPNGAGNQVYVNGTPITGSSSNMAVQSGAIVGLTQLRDTIAPQYQAQLDQIAGNLITAFQETDQSTTTPGLPALPGLFTTPGATSVPTSSNFTGLANQIVVNPTVDPTQGGDATLLRDGGISSPTSGNYSYNTTNAASYNGRLNQLLSSLQTPMSFAPAAGLGSSSSLSDYAQTSMSWLQSANNQASANASYQSSLQQQASAALSNATGVNLDAELTQMLTIESSYTASAKLLTTAQSMLQSLVSAV